MCPNRRNEDRLIELVEDGVGVEIHIDRIGRVGGEIYFDYRYPDNTATDTTATRFLVKSVFFVQ